jgi:hypothetical protein
MAKLEIALCEEDMNPESLFFDSKGEIKFDAGAEADRLERVFQKHLIPNDPGPYYANQVYPAKMVDEAAAQRVILGCHDSLSRSFQLQMAERDEASGGYPFIPRNRRLYEYPTIPAIGLRMIEALINRELARILPFARQAYPEKVFNSLLLSDDITYEEIYDSCGRIPQIVNQFVGEDVWSYHFVRLNGTVITINKSVDYRVYEWHRQRYEKHVMPKDCSIE